MSQGVIIAPDERLERTCDPFDFDARPDAYALVHRLRSTMLRERGVGIAAPQVGLELRLFLIVPPDENPLACFNPKILDMSPDTTVAEEGCLSFPGLFPMVRRAVRVDVAYQTAAGEARTRRFTGRGARMFQHELDHLDGVLISTRASAQAMAMARARAAGRRRA